METHRYRKHISANMYCTSIRTKEVGCMKSKKGHCLANNEVWKFFKLAEPTLKHQQNILGLPTLSTSDNTSFSFSCSYSSAATIFCFFDKLKLKSSKICLFLSALHQFKPKMKDCSFSKHNCNDWSRQEQLTSHKSHRQCLVKVLTNKTAKKGCTGYWKMQPVLMFFWQKDAPAFLLGG